MHPDAPIQRASEEAPQVEAPSPPPAAEASSPPPVTHPELSLEESMEMEFGTSGEISAQTPEPPPVEEPPAEIAESGWIRLDGSDRAAGRSVA